MSRTPKPWWRKERRSWFVMLDGQQVNLGPDRDQAYQKFHELMAEPRSRPLASDSVAAICDAYLDWAEQHRSPDTYRWYKDRLQAFMGSIPSTWPASASCFRWMRRRWNGPRGSST